jgi:hypothetical protein
MVHRTPSVLPLITANNFSSNTCRVMCAAYDCAAGSRPDSATTSLT